MIFIMVATHTQTAAPISLWHPAYSHWSGIWFLMEQPLIMSTVSELTIT
jgi:hypothetical protein